MFPFVNEFLFPLLFDLKHCVSMIVFSIALKNTRAFLKTLDRSLTFLQEVVEKNTVELPEALKESFETVKFNRLYELVVMSCYINLS